MNDLVVYYPVNRVVKLIVNRLRVESLPKWQI
jgi:hypothetical protein